MLYENASPAALTAGLASGMLRDMAEFRRNLDKRHASLKNEMETGGLLDWFKDITDFITPFRGRYQVTDTNRRRRTNNHLKNEKGVTAWRTLASGMMAGMSSRSSKWFRLVMKKRALMKSKAVKVWLDECERILYQIFLSSNFYNSIHQFYGEIGGFGTAALIEFDDFEDVVRFECVTAGEYYVAQNSRRMVDTLSREFEMSIEQLLDAEFTLPPKMLADYKANPTACKDKKVTVCHMVGPNRDRVVGRNSNKHMPFMSVYWLQGVQCDETHGILRFKGFEESALICGRWDTTGNDAWGWSPGMLALPLIKQLQIETSAKAKGIEKSLDPPMQGPARLKNELIDLLPGGITYHDDANNQGLRTVYDNWRPDIGAVTGDIEKGERRVAEIFYEDVFMMLRTLEGVQPRNQQEIVERKAEKLVALGPVVDRLHREVLDPIIDRTWRIALRSGALPPPPAELEGEALDVDYISPLAQAQKALGLGNLERTIGFIGNVAGVWTTAVDKINVDALVDEYADQMALPPHLINSDQEVGALREQRSRQQQMQQLAAMAPAVRDGAQAATLLSQADSARATPLIPKF